jgi:hypothetical protein
MSTKLEHSRSNSNKTNQFVICFELRKVGQIKNYVNNCYVMYPCTYDKNLEMIQPLVQELYQFFLLPGGKAKNQTGPKSGL